MLLAALIFANVLLAEPVAVDGDTVRAGGETYRVANIDAPETGWRAQCPYEAALGEAAEARVDALMAQARRVVADPVGRRDRYGRVVARVRVDGADLGQTLIDEGLARPWRGRRESWCGAPR